MSELETNSSEKVGPLIGSVIIILIIIAGAFYLFSIIKTKVDAQKEKQFQIEQIENNNSDEIDVIESELNATEINTPEKELEALQVEFQI
jgi:hypothetical protein